jgi:hypothetical protein
LRIKCLRERVTVGHFIAFKARFGLSALFVFIHLTHHTMSTRPLNSLSHLTPDVLLTAMKNVTLDPSPGTDTASSNDSPPPFRPFVSYTHAQILFLYKSPLISPPEGMPLLKDWFGYAIPYIPFLSPTYNVPREWNEQNASKKDSDSSAATSGARDKRCVSHEVQLIAASF